MRLCVFTFVCVCVCFCVCSCVRAGFPRNLDNLEGWIRVVGLSARVELVLFFDCTSDVMERRLLIRGETSGRTDDNIESIRKRFATYYAETMPIIHAFEAQGKVRHISADRPKEDVWADVQRIIDQLERVTAPTYYRAAVRATLPAASLERCDRAVARSSCRRRLFSVPRAGFRLRPLAFKRLPCQRLAPHCELPRPSAQFQSLPPQLRAAVYRGRWPIKVLACLCARARFGLR